MKNMSFLQGGYCEVCETKDVQSLLMYLFEIFKSICEHNGFRYFAFGGTLLGAVRHSGFIPWDDDMDVGMPRPDYERFLDYMKDYCDGTVEIMNYPEKNYAYPFAKFCLSDSYLFEDYIQKYAKIKLYLDIFPIDGYPPEKLERKHFSKLRMLKKLRTIKMDNNIRTKENMPKGEFIVHLLIQSLAFFIPMNFIIKAEIDEGKKYSFDTCEYSSLQGAGWCEKGKIKRDDLEKITKYSFENSTIAGICNTDYNLSMFYGDYMSLPPVEGRQSNHNYQLYVSQDLFDAICNKPT